MGSPIGSTPIAVVTPSHGLGSRRRLLEGRDWLLPAALSLGVVVLLGPELFRATIPSDSDLPGHFLTVDRLRSQLLSSGRIHGWSHDWFGGFPLFYFYFPLPSLVAAALGMLVHPALALRLVVAAGLVTLPWALWAYGRASGVGRAGTAGVVLGGALFLLMTSHHALGGNILSTLAGEFSYSWSLALSVLYLALLSRPRAGRLRLLPGVVLAAAMLSHVLPASVAALASANGLRHADLRGPTLRAWVVGAGLSAFWTLPLIVRIGYIGNRGWSYVPERADYLPAELLLLVPAALLALWLLRGRRAYTTLAIAGLLALATVLIPQELIGRGRLIPVWALAIHVLAGAGTGLAFASGRRALRAAALALGVVPLLVLLGSRDLGGVRTFAHRILEGIEAKEGAPELEALLAALSREPPSRAHWESTEESERWGGAFAFALMVPLRTEHTVLGGLLGESAPLSARVREVDRMLAGDPPEPVFAEAGPPVPYDPARGIGILRELGVRYFVTTTERTQDAIGRVEGVRSLGRFGGLELNDLGPDPLVVGESGGTAVRDVAFERGRIRFVTDAPGAPHTIRASFFPNWRAVGGEALQPADDVFMTVVPRSRSVTLEFRPTWVERTGTAVSLLALAALVVAGVGRRGGRSTAEPDDREVARG